MAYPKRLTAKTIEKRFKASGLSDEKISFLQKLFLAATNFYGMIYLNDLYGVYGELKEMRPSEYPSITLNEMITFSTIARRQHCIYYILEVDEVFNEPHNDEERIIINSDYVTSERGDDKYRIIYHLDEAGADKPHFVLGNLLDYTTKQYSPEQKKLLRFLQNLKSNETYLKDKDGKKCPNKYRGKLLRNIKALCYTDKVYLKLKQQEWSKSYAEQDIALLTELFTESETGPLAQLIFDNYLEKINLGFGTPNKALQDIFLELEDAGVTLSKVKVKELLDLVKTVNNTTHLYVNKGWAPSDLHKRVDPNAPLKMSFGPGIQQAIADGMINPEEIKKRLQQMGINPVGL